MTRNLFVASGIFHPETGGPATYLREILPELQSRDWAVKVLTYGNAKLEAHDYPYEVQRVKRRVLPVRLFDYGWQSRSQARWADVIYAHTIDLPVVWRDTPRVIKIVGDQAWERCVRLGWVDPTEDIDDFQTKDTYKRIINVQRDSRSRQVQDFDGVIVPSDYLKKMVMGWGVPEGKIHRIYNALPPMREIRTKSQAEAREALSWDDRPTLFTAARLAAWKGVDHIIEALKQVPDVRLVVAGDGDQYEYLKELAAPLSNRIEFVGFVPHETVSLMMQAADYFVLYSGYEGLPHTILESLRVGTPVIASDKGGNTEVVQHNVNGLLVPYVDIHELSSTIRSAFRGDKRVTLAANTQQGLDRFSFDNMVEETHNILAYYAGIR